MFIIGKEGGAQRHLRQHGFRHPGVVMADIHRATAEQIINIFAPRNIPDMGATAFPQDDLSREIAEMPTWQHTLGEGVQFLFFGRWRDAGHGAGSGSGVGRKARIIWPQMKTAALQH